MNISERAKKISPSITLAISAKAKEMKKNGVDVLNFSTGEPDLDTPQEIKEAAIKAMNEGFTKYTAEGGILELKDAIIEKYKREQNLTYKREEVFVSNGGKHSIHNIFQTVLNVSDEVVIPSPFWLSYADQVLLSDGVPVVVPTTKEYNFKITPKQLTAAITPKTKVLILNSPSNPTGSVYSFFELKKLAEVVRDKNILIISDDVYEKFVFDGTKFSNILTVAPEMKEKVVIINSVSKTYSMPGWRIGYALGPADIIKTAGMIQGQATSCPNSISQKAVTFALNMNQDIVEKFRQIFEKRRDIIYNGLKEISGIYVVKPAGAFYAFPDVSAFYGKIPGVKDSVSLCNLLLEKSHIACVPGAAFGDDNCIRFSFATDEQSIEKGLEKLRKLFC